MPGILFPMELIARVLDLYRKCYDKNGLSVYGVIEKNSGQLIGAAGYNIKDSVGEIELICHLSKKSWGKGYGTEVIRDCIEVAKQNRAVKTLYASADPKNINSTKILEKVGFQFIEMRWFEDTGQEEPYFEYKL